MIKNEELTIYLCKLIRTDFIKQGNDFTDERFRQIIRMFNQLEKTKEYQMIGSLIKLQYREPKNVEMK